MWMWLLGGLSVLAVLLLVQGGSPALARCPAPGPSPGSGYVPGNVHDGGTFSTSPIPYDLGGVYSQIEVVEPWVESLYKSGSNSWVMLDLRGEPFWAQVGTITFPNRFRANFGQFVYDDGTPSFVFGFEAPFNKFPLWTFHYYTMLYGNAGYHMFTWQIDGVTLRNEQLNFNPFEAYVSGEINYLDDQMPGGSGHTEKFQDIHVWHTGAWRVANLAAVNPYSQYFAFLGGNGEFTIWDWRCYE